MRTVFSSRLAGDFASFLLFKRTLGYSYRRAEFTLRAFDRFLVQQAGSTGYDRLGELMLSWLGRSAGRKPRSAACELVVLRQLHTFLQRRGCRGLHDLSWPQIPATSTYVPHVFTKAEVRELLRLTETLGRPPFRRILYRMLLLVLYCTGLRFGEATRLRLRDVDLARGILFILPSKGRSRWVPYHPSLGREFRRYLVARTSFAPGCTGPDTLLFLGQSGRALRTKAASLTVRRLLRIAGFKPAAGRVGPRPYDMRHAFAVHRLTRWYRARVDLHARLPWLSAYMGHDDLLGTETYLTATPELLSLAGDRFRRRFVARPERCR
jgi:site-specific recombinase XerD